MKRNKITIMFKTLRDDIKTVFNKDTVAKAIRLVLEEQDKIKERLKKLETSGRIVISKDKLARKRENLCESSAQ